MKEAVNLEAWSEEVGKTSGITTEELDARSKKYQDKYEEYERAKQIASDLYKEAEELEGKLVEALELAGKSKYYVEGIGTFYFMDKMTVPTPKTIEQKKQLFNYIKETHGDVFLMDKVSINHQTLQTLYKTDFEEHKEKCLKEGRDAEAANFSIPGLQAPTNMRSLGLKKEKK